MALGATPWVAANLLLFAVLLALLHSMGRQRLSFNVRVFTGLVLGGTLGVTLQAVHGSGSDVVRHTTVWIAVVGTGYASLLEMIVSPLVFVAVTSAITTIDHTPRVGRLTGQIVGVLVGTAAVAAVVGVAAAALFGLNASALQSGDNEARATQRIETRLQEFQSRPIPQQLVDIIPTNPFYALAGQGPSPTLSVVLLAVLTGAAMRGMKKKAPQSVAFLQDGLAAAHDLVMRLVKMILRLAPFGVLALMARFLLNSDVGEIARLATFVLASYSAILLMFGIHLLIVAGCGLNPVTFARKSVPALTFAFTSRSSAGTLPLTVQTQVDRLGVPEGLASLAASLGTSIGQNGCAGIYPAMLAVMIAPTVGVDPFALTFLGPLVIVVALGSIGIAGVGGGATFAALTVLSAMGLPVGLVGLLIAIEPLIDMARTALNVSDALVAGVVTSRWNRTLDRRIFASTDVAASEMAGA